LSNIFQKTILHNMMKEEHYLRQVRRLFNAFDNMGFEYVPFKGPFWSVPLYEAYHWRHIGDIDLLLPKADVRRATGMMMQMGYRPHFLRGSLDWNLANSGELAFTPDPSRPDDVVVELHWDPMPSRRFMRRQYLSYDDFTCRTTPGQWRGVSYALPSLEIQFMYLVLHATCQHQFMRFTHVATLVHFIQRALDLDWERAFDLSVSRNASIPLYYGLVFADAFWPLPDSLRELKARIRIPPKSRLVAAILPPQRILKGNDKKGKLRRNLFRTAMSW